MVFLMAGYTCPFCSHIMALDDSTHFITTAQFTRRLPSGIYQYDSDFKLQISFFNCPHCNKISSVLQYSGKLLPQKSMPIYPISNAKIFPGYIPEAIRSDYEEACSIVNLSPKASATLSRRCLQNMIRDFWGISRHRLIDEINELQEKVPATQWKVIDSLRRIGNIGAHPEADVNLIIDINHGDAQKLIQVIELLIKQWYIERHEQEQLYTDVLGIDEVKQEQRSKE
jgi:hypothetical protein